MREISIPLLSISQPVCFGS